MKRVELRKRASFKQCDLKLISRENQSLATGGVAVRVKLPEVSLQCFVLVEDIVI